MKDGVNAILLRQKIHTLANASRRDGFDHASQPFLSLPNNPVEGGRAHAGALQLFKDATGFHGLVLPRIANEENTVRRLQTAQEVAHVFARDKARFIDKE